MKRGAVAIASPSAGRDSTEAYRVAIEQTTQVIVRRAKFFRSLVAVVVVIALASLVWALAARSPSGLLGFLLIVPACGFFFYADARLLNRWRSEIAFTWVTRDLDVAALCEAIRANHALPTGTIESMLATLPRTGNLVAEQRLLAPTRKAIAAAYNIVGQGRADSLLLNATASLATTISLVAAASMGTWTPLLGLTIIILWPAAGALMRRRRRAVRDAHVEACRRTQGFSEAEYAELVAGLPW
jgi:hypothetical protein